MPREALQATGLFKEGLEYKWAKESQRISYEEMLAATKSKRYLRSSLKRLGAELLLSPAALPSPFLAPPDPSYARLLALKREKSTLLRNLPLPIITSTAKAMKTLPKEAPPCSRWTSAPAMCSPSARREKIQEGQNGFLYIAGDRGLKDLQTDRQEDYKSLGLLFPFPIVFLSFLCYNVQDIFKKME